MPKHETVELLAGGIAHDFDALLTTIVGRAENLSDYISPGDPRAADVAAIREAAEAAASLTQQLLAFSRRQALRPTVVDLNAVVESLRYKLHRLLGTAITLETRAGAGLLRVRADADHLEDILCNLAVNARDAMPIGGTLTIATANATFDAEEAAGREVEPGEYVELSLQDTGVGMGPAVQAHLFEPFFTTKERARGTGLGLAMVHGIVRQSGGCIGVESAVGQGSRFAIYLPATEELPTPGKDASPERGSETVLLVGDDHSVQSFVADVLKRRGYDILVGHDVWQALRMAEACERPIDLLIAAGPNSAIVAETLCTRRPEMRVLYVSASEADIPGANSGKTDPLEILHMPFSPAALARKVRAVLRDV
jgi:two-component system, cell cycle sensor histidine kinase and response regulator CckA